MKSLALPQLNKHFWSVQVVAFVLFSVVFLVLVMFSFQSLPQFQGQVNSLLLHFLHQLKWSADQDIHNLLFISTFLPINGIGSTSNMYLS